MAKRSSIHLFYFFFLLVLPFGIWELCSMGSGPAADRLLTFLYGCISGFVFVAPVIALTLIKRTYSRWLAYSLNLLSYSIATFVVFYQIHYGFPFSSASLISILETNKQEASEFIHSFSAWQILLFALIFLCVHAFIFFLTRNLSRKIIDLRAMPKLLLLGGMITLYGFCILKNDLFFQYNMFYSLRDSYYQYQEEKTLIAQQGEDLRKQKFSFTAARSADPNEPETYVLVIGESLSKHHMSLYGYPRKTNPQLEKMRAELLVFDDVISPNNTTVMCLQKILSFANCTDREALFSKPGILQVLNKAGFETWWISNQCYSGVHDSWATLFSRDAKEKRYTNFVNSINSTPVYDEAVLDPLQEALKAPAKKKFIIVHLIGSHQRADFRYPLAFSKFSSTYDQPLTYPGAGAFEKNYVNHYDNSVLYNDHVLSSIIQKVKEVNQSSFVFYFPDHGEEVCEQSDLFGHSDGVLSRYMVEIPMILWQSELFKKSHNMDKATSNRPYQTDDVIHSILDILQVSCDHFVPGKSIFNPCFIPEKRWIEDRWDYDSLVPLIHAGK